MDPVDFLSRPLPRVSKHSGSTRDTHPGRRGEVGRHFPGALLSREWAMQFAPPGDSGGARRGATHAAVYLVRHERLARLRIAGGSG